MTCKDCIHFKVCDSGRHIGEYIEDDGVYSEGVEEECEMFEGKHDKEIWLNRRLAEATREIHKLIYDGPLKGKPATRVRVCHQYNDIIHRIFGVRADGGCLGCPDKATCQCHRDCKNCKIAKRRREKFLRGGI